MDNKDFDKSCAKTAWCLTVKAVQENLPLLQNYGYLTGFLKMMILDSSSGKLQIKYH